MDFFKDDESEVLRIIEDRYIENRALLLAYGCEILGSKDRAEDALHETFWLL